MQLKGSLAVERFRTPDLYQRVHFQKIFSFYKDGKKRSACDSRFFVFTTHLRG